MNIQDHADELLSALSERERLVFHLRSLGKSFREIAEQAGLKCHQRAHDVFRKTLLKLESRKREISAIESLQN